MVVCSCHRQYLASIITLTHHSYRFFPPTVVDCGLLPNISMGNVLYVNSSTLYQSLVVYECVPGYLLTRGNGERTCLATGQWSGVPPVCIVNSKSVVMLCTSFWGIEVFLGMF